jgi:hypothetical protein
MIHTADIDKPHTFFLSSFISLLFLSFFPLFFFSVSVVLATTPIETCRLRKCSKYILEENRTPKQLLLMCGGCYAVFPLSQSIFPITTLGETAEVGADSDSHPQPGGRVPKSRLVRTLLGSSGTLP